MKTSLELATMSKKGPKYSEIPYDDEECLVARSSPTVRYRASSPLSRKLFTSNQLVILLLFALISIISFTFLVFLNTFNRLYNRSFDFVPLDQGLSANSTFRREAYFNETSQVYHLAQDQNKASINHNFRRLNNTQFYCFKEGTNWNQSMLESKCVCQSNYSLADCGLSDQVLKSQLLNKQSSCHFKQDMVNIKRLNMPSRIVFAMPLYECAKRECGKLIDELVKQYEHIVDLFVFVEIRNSKQLADQAADANKLPNATAPANSSVDERVRLYTFTAGDAAGKASSNPDATLNKLATTADKQVVLMNANDPQLNKQMKVAALKEQHKRAGEPEASGTVAKSVGELPQNSTTSNPTANRTNVIYQVKTFDLDAIGDSKEIVAKVYGSVWSLLFGNVANYRPTDRIILMPPFAKVNSRFLNFFKFYFGFGEPVVLVDNFYTRTAYSRRIPKDIQDDLNQMNSAVMFSFQYAQSVCKFKFSSFSQDYCANNLNLVSHFEKNFWKVCQVTANALYS